MKPNHLAYVTVGTAALLLAAATTQASTIEVIGGLSNFDVWNRTGDSSDGFEIELYDVSDISSTYNWSSFRTPTVQPFTSPTGSGMRVIYDGRSIGAGTQVAPDVRQHFGVRLGWGTRASRVVYNWLVEDPTTGNLVHAPLALNTGDVLPTLPSPEWDVTPTGAGIQGTIRNDNDRPIWVKAARAANTRQATLDELLPDDFAAPGGDDLIGGQFVEPADPFEARILNPGDTLSEPEDLMEGITEGGTAIFWVYEYIGDVDDSGNAIGEDPVANRGVQIGTLMSAANVAAVVPEPATALLFGMALASSSILRRYEKMTSALEN